VFRRVAAVAFSLVAFGAASAPGRQLTLLAGHLIDGKGGEAGISRVVVENGSILSILPGSGPADIDLSCCTLLPGIVDTHVHISWHFDADGKSDDDGHGESRAATALYTLENAVATLDAGVTTVQSLGAAIDGPVRDAIARGRLPGPRILTSLEPIWDEKLPASKLRETVHERAEQGADVIKVFASKSIRDGGGPTFSQQQLDAVCGEARHLGLRVAVHAHGPESARRAAIAGCSSIEHGVLLDRATLRFLADKGLYFDPNIHLIFRNYFENKSHFLGTGNFTEEGFRQMESAVGRAHEVFRAALETPGLRVVFGTDAVAGAHGRNLEELIDRVQSGGQSAMDAIVSATSLAAQSLGLDDRVGSLSPGYEADLIAVEGNPLVNVTTFRKVVFVLRSGTIWKGGGAARAE